MRRFLHFLLIATVAAAAVACRRHVEKQDVGDVEETVISDYTEEILKKADSLLSSMTIEQKVGQLFMPALYARSDYFTIKKVKEYATRYYTGGLILLKGDIDGAVEVADTLAVYSSVAPFVAIDAEWGLAMRLSDAPRFVSNLRLSEISDEETMYAYGSEVARECRQLGINMVMGPVMDVAPAGSPMRFRSFGDNPERVGELAVAYSSGLESGGVISVAKHFPGHGSVFVDSHKKTPVISRNRHELDSLDLVPFIRYVDRGLSGVMVGHLSVPAVDSEALPAAVSRAVITDLLRDSLGFKGLVLTDALNMGGVRGYGASMAFKAGADIILAPIDTEKSVREIMELVENDPQMMDYLDEKVRRILFYKLLKGIISGKRENTTDEDSDSDRASRVNDVPENLDAIRRFPTEYNQSFPDS